MNTPFREALRAYGRAITFRSEASRTVKEMQQGLCGDGGGTGGEKRPPTHNQGGRDGDSVSKMCRRQSRCFTTLEQELLESLYTEGKLSNVLSREAAAARMSLGGNPMSHLKVVYWVKNRHAKRLVARQLERDFRIKLLDDGDNFIVF